MQWAQAAINSLLFPTGHSLGSGCPDPPLAAISCEQAVQLLDVFLKTNLGLKPEECDFSLITLQKISEDNSVFTGILTRGVRIKDIKKDRGGKARGKRTFVGLGIPYACPSNPELRTTVTVFENGKFNLTGLPEGENDAFPILQKLSDFIAPYLTDTESEWTGAIADHLVCLEYEKQVTLEEARGDFVLSE